MIAIDDNNSFFGSAVRVPRISLAPLVSGIAVLAVALVFGAVVARGFSENGFRLGSMLAWRYAAVIFFIALISGPVCRIASRLAPGFVCPDSLSRKLVWGFCASYGVYLLSVFVPNVLELSAGATLMVVFGGGVTIVMALTAAPIRRLGRGPLIGPKTRRSMLGMATIYFWSTYALMALSRLAGPHRPDAWYGISLGMMVAALLIRYADRWIAPRRPAAQGGIEAAI